MSVRAMKWAYQVLETNSSITAKQSSILLCLCWHHNEREGSCFPSMNRISEITKISVRGIFDEIKNLEKCGLIEVKKTKSKGRFAQNNYKLFGKFKMPNRRQTGADGTVGTKKPTDRRQTGADGTVGKRGPNKESNIYTSNITASNVVALDVEKTRRSAECFCGSGEATSRTEKLVDGGAL